jgi:hypothetical protein
MSAKTKFSPLLKGLAPMVTACLFGAAQAVQVTAEYSYGGDVSQNEACRRAEERAKTMAIISVLGEVVSSEDQMLCSSITGKKDTCEFNFMSWSFIDGDIRGVREIKSLNAERRGLNEWACVLTLDVDVVVPTRKPDPNFQVKSETYFLVPDAHRATRVRDKMPRSRFHVGDEFVFEVNSTEPAHMALFGWAPSDDNKVHRLDGPGNELSCVQDGPTPINEGKTAASYCIGLKWSDAYKDNNGTYEEWLLLVATKTPNNWMLIYDLNQFKSALREIPLDQRRVVRRPYRLMK